MSNKLQVLVNLIDFLTLVSLHFERKKKINHFHVCVCFCIVAHIFFLIFVYHVEFLFVGVNCCILYSLLLNQRNLLLSIAFRQRLEIPSTLPIELQYMSVEFPVKSI